MTHDGLDSAYATLGLRRDASAAAVKRRYRALVRQWHPDRFTNDPQGVAEATLMLKAINRAYRTIVERRAPDAVEAAPVRQPSASDRSTSFGGRLTPEQRDEIIDAIRQSESLLAMALDDGVAGWRSRAASAAVVSALVAVGWTSGDAIHMLEACLVPLFCIWFPDIFGAYVGGRITHASPPWLVWFLGWVVLVVLALGIGIVSLSAP